MIRSQCVYNTCLPKCDAGQKLQSGKSAKSGWAGPKVTDYRAEDSPKTMAFKSNGRLFPIGAPHGANFLDHRFMGATVVRNADSAIRFLL